MSRIITAFFVIVVVAFIISIALIGASSDDLLRKMKLRKKHIKESPSQRRAREDFEAKLDLRYPSSDTPTIGPLRTDTVTLSGFDGGASFASQYHIAYSSQFQAAALLSTIPYLCAEGTLAGSTDCLESPWLINNAALYTEAIGLVATGSIDSFSNLRSQYVRIGASPDDTLVNYGGSKQAASMYQAYLNVGTVETDFNLNGANHAWVTSKYGNQCGQLGAPYISKCVESFAETSMQKMFAHMQINTTASAATFNQSNLYTISQKNYGANPTENALAEKAFVFIPPQCEKSATSKSGKKCHFHMHFHGCNQSSGVVFDQYALSTQLNEFAVANDVVIFYPQAAVNIEFLNPAGCFDFYGFEIDLAFPLAYATKLGGQMKIMNEMQHDFVAGYF